MAAFTHQLKSQKKPPGPSPWESRTQPTIFCDVENQNNFNHINSVNSKKSEGFQRPVAPVNVRDLQDVVMQKREGEVEEEM